MQSAGSHTELSQPCMLVCTFKTHLIVYSVHKQKVTAHAWHSIYTQQKKHLKHN